MCDCLTGITYYLNLLFVIFFNYVIDSNAVGRGPCCFCCSLEKLLCSLGLHSPRQVSLIYSTFLLLRMWKIQQNLRIRRKKALYGNFDWDSQKLYLHLI